MTRDTKGGETHNSASGGEPEPPSPLAEDVAAHGAPQPQPGGVPGGLDTGGWLSCSCSPSDLPLVTVLWACLKMRGKTQHLHLCYFPKAIKLLLLMSI